MATSFNQFLKTLGWQSKQNHTLIDDNSVENVSSHATKWSGTNCSALPATLGLVTICFVVAAFYSANTPKFKSLLSASIFFSILTALSACIPIKKNCDELCEKNDDNFGNDEEAAYLPVSADVAENEASIPPSTQLSDDEDEITEVPLRAEDRLLVI